MVPIGVPAAAEVQPLVGKTEATVVAEEQVVVDGRVSDTPATTAADTQEVEEPAEVPSSGGRALTWRGVHVGVWVAIGAGVAVGAALWARRR